MHGNRAGSEMRRTGTCVLCGFPLLNLEGFMVDDDDRWRQLCAQASQEQDPDKLIELVSEIIRILESKDIRAKNSPAPPPAPTK